MQTNRPSHASRFLRHAVLPGLLLFAGCSSPLTNLTPATLAGNPSSVYTISYHFGGQSNAIIPGTLKLVIIIQGEPHEMTKSATVKDIYNYDYPAPPGQTELKYYVLADYTTKDEKGKLTTHQDYSSYQTAKIAGRFVFSLSATRGQIGARVGVLGNGFTPDDKVTLDGTPARTAIDSPSSLGFYIPAVESGHDYKVLVTSPTGTTMAGTLHVDSSPISVSPTALNLRQGETQKITFTLPAPAPFGGLLIDLTSDVDNLVIMNQVIMVPEGATSYIVEVTGGQPNTGTLTLNGHDVKVPVTVSRP